MKIKERDSQHMVIGYTFWEQLDAMFRFVVAIGFIIATQFIPIIFFRVLMSIVGILFGLLILSNFIGRKIVIDKLTDSIIKERRNFLFIRRQRIITFSDVNSVVVIYEKKHYRDQYSRSSHDAWMVYLKTRRKPFMIDHKTNRADMFNLAEGISSFLEKELIDKSAKPQGFVKRFSSKE